MPIMIIQIHICGIMKYYSILILRFYYQYISNFVFITHEINLKNNKKHFNPVSPISLQK